MQKNLLTLILLAAGKAQRMKQKIPKPYLKSNQQPIINYSLRFFDKIKEVNNIIIVIDPKHENYLQQLNIKNITEKPFEVITGGKTRQESVFNALKHIKKKNYCHI